jgi:hypothetical protein
MGLIPVLHPDRKSIWMQNLPINYPFGLWRRNGFAFRKAIMDV